MQFGQPFGERALRLQREQVAQQVVIAEPLARAVEPHDQLVAGGDVDQPLRPARRRGDRVDQRAVEPVEHRGLQHPSAVVGLHRREQFVAEVADHQLVVAAERVDEPFRFRRPFQRETGQHQAGGPSLGAGAEVVDRRRRERVAHRTQQHGGLARGEAQVVGSHLADPVAHPHASEAERRVEAGGDHDRQLRRAQVDEPLHPAVDGGVVDEVVVVDHHDERVAVVDEFVHHRRHDHPVVAGRTDHQRRQVVADGGTVAGDRRDERRPEPGRVGVAVVDLQPGHLLGPCGAQAASIVDLPEPAGALASTNGTARATASSSTESSRVRSTRRVGSAGGRSFVAAIPISPSSCHDGTIPPRLGRSRFTRVRWRVR